MRRLAICMGVLLVSGGCRSEAPIQTTTRLISPPAAVDLDPNPDVLRVRLVAAPHPSGGRFLYAYNGQNPGPTLYAKRGDLIEVELVNQLDTPTTIHWHGLHVPFEMDGVAWMREPTPPGGTFTYRFTVEQTGTFWYHPHFDTAHQVEGGLYGALIVEEPTEPAVDETLVLVFDAAHEVMETRGPHGHGRVVTEWLVNGQLRPEIELTGGTVVRARMINASNAGYLSLQTPGRRIAGDQGLLSAEETPSIFILGPGDRADFEWTMGESGFALVGLPYSLNGGSAFGAAFEVATVTVSSPQTAPPGRSWPFDGALATPDPGHTDIVYSLTGSDRTGVWMIGAERFPNVTIEEVPLGARPIVEVRNISATEHPFHMHGVSFEILSIDGQAPAVRTVEDTVNVRIYERLRLRVLADNPGDWMTHCHILPHAEDGMMTVFRVNP